MGRSGRELPWKLSENGGLASLVSSRRVFLQTGVAASSAPLISGLIGAWPTCAAAGAPGKIDFYKVVFDGDNGAAKAFGRAALAAGLPVQAIGRDVTALWYDDLYHRWREGPAAIAGLTPAHVAFCLQVFAQDVGMRLVFRGEHTPGADGRMGHRLAGPAPLLARAASMDAAGGWPQGAAGLLRQCSADISPWSSLSFSTAPSSQPTTDEPLVSWVIAPVSRA